MAKFNVVYGPNFVINHLKLRSFWLKMRNNSLIFFVVARSAIYLLKIGPRTKKSGHPCPIVCEYTLVALLFQLKRLLNYYTLVEPDLYPLIKSKKRTMKGKGLTSFMNGPSYKERKTLLS
jgi:hypothetical protein